jgi:hypothetical protein
VTLAGVFRLLRSKAPDPPWTNDAIDRARATASEDAKYDLEALGAVNARCVAAPR